MHLPVLKTPHLSRGLEGPARPGLARSPAQHAEISTHHVYQVFGSCGIDESRGTTWYSSCVVQNQERYRTPSWIPLPLSNRLSNSSVRQQGGCRHPLCNFHENQFVRLAMFGSIFGSLSTGGCRHPTAAFTKLLPRPER